MKDRVLVTAVIVIGLIVAGLLIASSQPGNGTETPAVSPVDTRWMPKVWLDPDTGCQYLIWNGRMSPRLDATGHPMCSQTLKPKVVS